MWTVILGKNNKPAKIGKSHIKKKNQKLSRDKQTKNVLKKHDFYLNVQSLLPLFPNSFRLWSMDGQ